MMAEHTHLEPTVRLLVLAGAGLMLAILPALGTPGLWPLWLVGMALLALAAGCDAVLSPQPDALETALEVPPLAGVGTRIEAVLSLRLAGTGTLGAQALLDLDPLFEPVPAKSCTLSPVPERVVFELRAERRGRAELERLWLRYGGPLGLLRRVAVWRLERSVGIVPDIGFVRSRQSGALEDRVSELGRRTLARAGDGTDFHALREFLPGLDVRSIDWKASARHRRLLARETRAERNHQLIVALDRGRLMAEPMAGLPLLDHAIHSALQLALAGLRHGDRVSLFSFAARPDGLLAAARGPGGFANLLDWTSRLAYGHEETNFTLALTELLAQLHRRSLVVVLTDFADSVAAELMVDNVLRVGRRHLVLFVAFRDPLLAELAAAEPTSLHDLRRATVVAGFQRERELVLGRLRKAGILTLDAEPREVGPRLIDRYLEIHRRELV